jgi:tetratricopeptide (TPR) repeat protein
LQNTGNYVESIPPLLTVIEKTPSDYEAQAMLAEAYFESGQSDKAYSLLNSVIKQNSQSIEAYLLRAEIYLKQGKIEEASEDYTSALRIDYNNFDANLGKGRVLLAQTLAGAAYNAFDYTEKFANTDAQKAVLLYWRAKALIVLDQPEAAVNNLKRHWPTPEVYYLPTCVRMPRTSCNCSIRPPRPLLQPKRPPPVKHSRLPRPKPRHLRKQSSATVKGLPSRQESSGKA